jgi:hypothetical protein
MSSPPDRQLLFLIAPPKPVSAMTDEEYDAWADALSAAVASPLYPEAPTSTTEPPPAQ